MPSTADQQAPTPPDPHSATGSPDIAYPATLENVVKAALKLHALDINNDGVIDDFARLEYCQVYKAHYLDEFVWKKVRAALRQQIQQDLPTYPSSLFLDRLEYFTTYDFKTGRLQMEDKSIFNDVNEMRLTPMDTRSACGAKLSSIYQDFVVNISQPLNINGIKLSEDEANAVVSGLANDSHEETIERHGYGRYFITLDRVVKAPPELKNAIMFVGNVDRVTFYEDNTYQKPFWSGIDSVPDYNSSDSADIIPFKGIDTQGPQ